MGDKTAIAWTDSTWNPTVGCSRVSEGCRHCYAEQVAHSLVKRFGSEKYKGLTREVAGEARWTGEVRLVEKDLDLPLRWRKPRRIFVNSMSDMFHENLQWSWIDAIFSVVSQCQQHTFQVLTKRPQEMLAYAKSRGLSPLPNVWLGVSVENQATADARIPLLLQTPAAVRWVSYEPALGPVDFRPWLHPRCQGCGNYREPGDEEHAIVVPTGDEQYPEQGYPCGPVDSALDWLVVGGESGPKARPFDPAWAFAVKDQCRAAGVAFFMKQIGDHPVYYPYPDRVDSLRIPWKPKKRGGSDPAEWYEDLRVQEFPRGR